MHASLQQKELVVQRLSTQLREKDERLQQKDELIQRKNADISTLQREIQILQVSDSVSNFMRNSK